MTKVVVTGEYSCVPKGTILEVSFIDDVGDARLTDEDSDKYDGNWVFSGDFERIAKKTKSEHPYTILIHAGNVAELQEILSDLSGMDVVVSEIIAS